MRGAALLGVVVIHVFVFDFVWVCPKHNPKILQISTVISKMCSMLDILVANMATKNTVLAIKFEDDNGHDAHVGNSPYFNNGFLTCPKS